MSPPAPPRVGVLGHVEWVEFAVVDRLPGPGEIVRAREAFADAGGGGAIAAVQMARMAGNARLVTALGDDAHAIAAAERLALLGVSVHAAARSRPQRRAFVHLSAADHERAITIVGERMIPCGGDALPWASFGALDGVYVTAGDAEAIAAARAARVVVATARAAPGLVDARIPLDAVVLSAADPDEQGIAERLDPAPALVLRTEGPRGGAWAAADGTTGRWAAAPLPGPPVDAFGCGDTFAAALTVALAAGRPRDDALAYAARAGAAVLCGRGPYGAPLEPIAAPTA